MTFVRCDPRQMQAVLRPLRCGPGDASLQLERVEAWRAARFSSGPATVHVRAVRDGVEAEAWGPGRDEALASLPDLLGCADDAGGFAPRDEPVRGLHRLHGAPVMGKSHGVFEAALPTILEQKVTVIEAHRSFRALMTHFGEPAPGPGRLRLRPSPERIAHLPYEAFHRCGIERRRAETLRRVAVASRSLDRVAHAGSGPLDRALQSIPGVGPWTSAIVRQLALGDADAVIVGDFHLPNVVAWVLAREARADDERMLELLQPFQGHRARAVRLISRAGSRPPKFGPKHRLRDLSRI